MSADSHIIQKQILELKFSDKNNNPALVEKIKNTYYETTVPQLDHLFSEMVKGDLVIRLNKLEVDIGSIEVENIEHLITGKILRAVKKELENSLRFEVKDKDNIQILSPAESSFNILLYFLKNGHLPWWADLKDLKTLERQIQSNSHSNAEFSSGLMKLINTDSRALARLDFQFSNPFKYYLIEKVVVSDSDKARLSGRLLPKDYTPPDLIIVEGAGKPKNTVDPTFDPVLNQDENAVSDQDIPLLTDPQKEKDRVIQIQKESEDGEINTIQNSTDLKSPIPAKETFAENPETYPQETTGKTVPNNKNNDNKEINKKPEDADKEDFKGRKKEEINRTGKEENNVWEKVYPIIDAAGKEVQKKPDLNKIKQNPRPESERESIYVDLAGLVIIHPFIVQFFEGFQLLHKKDFNNREHLERAVQLLGYLATGEKEIDEHLLLLPKFLCGLDFSEPVKKEILIEPVEQKEIEELLSTVITYWGALKNTSPAGLRNNFLQRKGKLSPREGGWQLDVEPKTWDILLKKLPWGISVVKLPWMKEMLYVNWQ